MSARVLKGQLQNRTGEETQLFFEKFPDLALSKVENSVVIVVVVAAVIIIIIIIIVIVVVVVVVVPMILFNCISYVMTGLHYGQTGARLCGNRYSLSVWGEDKVETSGYG